MSKKAQMMDRWKKLREGGPMGILYWMTPNPRSMKGSRFGTNNIRIMGEPKFVDAVLSNLADLIDGENEETLLHLSQFDANEVVKSDQLRSCPNVLPDAEVIYISLLERGNGRR